MNLTFILLGDEHLPASLRLLHQLNPTLDLQTIERRLQAMYQHTQSQMVGMSKEDGQLIAVATIWTTDRIYCGRQAELDNVVVDSRYRNSGLGRLFMEEVEKWAEEQAYDTIELNTYVENVGSHRFYERLGFTLLGRHYIKEISGSDVSCG